MTDFNTSDKYARCELLLLSEIIDYDEFNEDFKQEIETEELEGDPNQTNNENKVNKKPPEHVAKLLFYYAFLISVIIASAKPLSK